MDDKNIAVENLIGRDKVIELLKERAKTSLYAHAERLLRTIIRDIEAISIMNPQEHEPQCGTCRYFTKHPDTCMKGWSMIKHIIPGLIGSDSIQSMCELDGHNCPDWEEQYKKERRIWSCLNCGKDIYFLKPTFVHVDSGKHKCSNRISNYDNVAIPHPDKPMRTE